MDFDRLCRRRVAAKSWATRAANALSDLLDRKPAVPEDEQDLRLGIQSARRECETRLAALDEVQAQVECELTDEALESDLDVAYSFREGIKKVLLRAEARQSQPAAAGSATAAVGDHGARLPKLELPKFDGDVIQWAPFWDAFKSAVDQSELSDVSKLTYLRSLLRGEARRAVEGLPLTASSYSSTCELLKARFGRREQVIFSHIQKLLQIGSGDVQLQLLVDDLLAQVRSLDTLGITGEQYGVILTPLILSRLPSDVRLEWARNSVGREGDLKHLLDFLQLEISRLERSGLYKDLEVPPSAGQQTAASSRQRTASAGRPGPAGSAGRRTGGQRTSAAALQAASSLCCSYCGQQHNTAKCSVWQQLSVRERFGWVRSRGLCFCCLDSSHQARHCAERCVTCGGRHHLTLCLSADDAGSPGSLRDTGGGVCASGRGPTHPVCASGQSAAKGGAGQSAAKGGAGQSAAKGGAGQFVPKSGVSLSCNTGGVTLLPVASVLVASPSGPVEANVIFDGGADRSFISKSLMKRVEGRYEGSVELTCASFGGAKMIDVCDCYEICVSAISPSMPTVERIEVVEVETISAPLRRPPVPDDLLRPFDHLQLASPVNRTSSDSVLHIDLVIGQDQYWNLVRSGLVRSSEGLVAMETAFGWVLSGSVGGQSCGVASA